MSRTYLNSIYRRHLRSHYTELGFDAMRHYVNMNGNGYATTPCYYCGLPATSEDHQPALVTYHSLLVLDEPPPPSQCYVVPACHECNGLLVDHVFPSLRHRKKYLKKRLRERYHKLLTLPDWEEKDMRDMGHTLKAFIRLGEVQREILHERLIW